MVPVKAQLTATLQTARQAMAPGKEVYARQLRLDVNPGPDFPGGGL